MMQKGLKRGLDALLGENASTNLNVLSEIDIHLIDPNPEQPRKRFDQPKLEELAESIRNVGVISPILVCQNGERYTIIAGERRWRASRLAGLSTVPVIIRPYDQVRRMEVSLIENLQRDDLNPIEEAEGIRALMEECGLTQEAVSQRICKSRPAVTNLLRLLSLSQSLQGQVRDGRLSEGHARALLGLNDEKLREDTAALIWERGWSVRQTEAHVRSCLDSKVKNPPNTSPESRAMEELVRKAVGTRVSIQGSHKKGKVCLHYSSYQEFERIYDWIRMNAGIEE